MSWPASIPVARVLKTKHSGTPLERERERALSGDPQGHIRVYADFRGAISCVAVDRHHLAVMSVPFS